MSDTTSNAAEAVTVPQVDVNDEEMLLVEWRVEEGAAVAAGQVLCVLETAKATSDLESPAAGVVRREGAEGDTVRVGQTIAWIGADAAAIEAARAAAAPSAGDAGAGAGEVRGTPKALELASEHGIELADVPRKGSLVKEKDVRAFLAGRGASAAASAPAAPAAAAPEALPALIARRVSDAGPLPRHKQVIARHLAATQAGLIPATVEAEVRLDAAHARLEREADTGANLFHLVLHQVARALKDFPLLRTFRHGETTYCYDEIGIAITVVDSEHDQRLLTPVVAKADALSLEDTAEACLEVALEAYRGEIQQERLIGGCFTLSMLTGLEITRFTALQNLYQSAVLAVGSPTTRVVSGAGGGFAEAQFLSLTLGYDHGVCDGFYAGQFLTRVKAALESDQA